jgi:hypothetical protein
MFALFVDTREGLSMAARKARPDRAWTPDKVRERIKTALITNRLTDHVLGECEMAPTQVTAALGLLRKTLPDLTAIAHSGSVETTKPDELSDSLLAHIASGSSARVAETESGEEEPSELH